MAIEKITKEVADVSRALEQEVTETQAAQIQLDKAAEDFRQLHHDRQQLVKQWEEALDTVKKRDEVRMAIASDTNEDGDAEMQMLSPSSARSCA